MNIKIENTPNKNILKFVASRTLVEGSYEISNTEQAKNIPLAQELLQFPFVTNIFITANFIAIQKNDSIEWDSVSNEIKELIEDELLANPSVILTPRTEPITVYVEMTPNNSVMKFVTNKIILDGMVELTNIDQSEDVPLAQYLFSFPYVKEVFISDNFVSITKTEETSWDEISMEIRYNISQYLAENKEVSKIKNFSPHKKEQYSSRDLSETEKKIIDILEEYVLPAVSNDGGNISLVSFDPENKVATMVLQGACSGCPSSTITLKNGIESLLKEMLPGEVEAVEAING